MKALLAVTIAFGLFSLNSAAGTLLVESEATILSGTAAVSNIVESAAGYIHIKYHAPLTLARKGYFQFNLTNSSADLESPAEFQIFFNNTYLQRIQLWGLNQAYNDFNADISFDQRHFHGVAHRNECVRSRERHDSFLIHDSATRRFRFRQ
jgi:hypothetical protein